MRMRCKHLVVLLAVTPFAVQAQDDCLRFENLQLRYACWGSAAPEIPDEELEEARTKLLEEARGKLSDWQISTRKSDMTDDTNVYLSVSSDSPVKCSWNSGDVRLVLRCYENTTAAVLQTPCHVTSSRYDDYGDVTYRVDDKPAKERTFEKSTNNRALGLWSYRSARPFINDLFDGERLLLRFRPYGENAKEVKFDISGLRETIAPLRRACGW